MTVVGVIILTSFVLSLLNTLSLLFFTLFNARMKRFSLLTVSSTLTTLSLMLLYFDIDAIIFESTNLVATFFTFLTLSSALVILGKSFIQVLGTKNFVQNALSIVYVLLSSSLITLFTHLELSGLRSFIYYLIIVLPFSLILINIYIKDKTTNKYIVFYEMLVIVAIATVTFIYLTIYRLTNPSVVFPIIEVISSVLIAIILISMYFSFVLEIIAKDVKELDDKNILLELSNQKIKRASEIDALTGIYNRGKMNEILEYHYEKSLNSEDVFSVLILDADNFKSINDIFGHNEGDEVLKFISSSLTNILRDEDYLCRWGGDEFFALLPNIKNKEFAIIEEQIENYFKKYPYKNPKVDISLSVGLAQFESGVPLTEMINNADTMMYMNKTNRKRNKESRKDIIN